MFQKITFFSPFLKEKKVWLDLAQRPSLIICERKEDVKPIQTILSHHITMPLSDHIQIFTFDRLLGLLKEKEGISFLNSEDLIHYTHLLFHLVKIPLQDSQNLARQLIAFSSFPGNRKEFFDLFLAFCQKKSQINLDYLSRQFLVIYQFLHFHLSQISSLPSLKGPKLFENLPPHIEKKLLTPQLLWMRSPQYEYQGEVYQSGLQDPTLVSNILEELERFREKTLREKQDFCLEFHFQWDSKPLPLLIETYPSWKDLAEDLAGKEPSTLLGDVNLTELSHLFRTDETWGKSYTNFSESHLQKGESICPSHNQFDLKRNLESLHQKQTEIFQTFQPFKKDFQSFLKEYHLSSRPLDPQVFFQESLSLKPLSFSDPFLKPLHLQVEKPNHLWVLGPPHQPRSPSWRIQFFNQFFSFLEKKGIPLFRPTSPLTYLAYWSSLRKDLTSFKVLHWEKNLEKLYHIKGTLIKRRGRHQGPWFEPDPNFKNPPTQVIGKPSSRLSARSFALYLYCPQRFHLSEELLIQRFAPTEEGKPSPLELGSLYHETFRFAHLTAFTWEDFQDQLPWPHCDGTWIKVLKSLLPQAFQNYRELLPKDGSRTWLEYPFQIQKPTFKLSGRFDRLDWEPETNEWTLTEIKTTQSLTPKKIKTRLLKKFENFRQTFWNFESLQLLIYASAWSQMIETTNLTIQIWSLSYPDPKQKFEKSSYSFQNDEIKKIQQALDQEYAKLIKGDRSYKNHRLSCQSCPYFQNHCFPYVSLS